MAPIFVSDYPSCFLLDGYSQIKWVPRPFTWGFFNARNLLVQVSVMLQHIHSITTYVADKYSSITVNALIGAVLSFDVEHI